VIGVINLPTTVPLLKVMVEVCCATLLKILTEYLSGWANNNTAPQTNSGGGGGGGGVF